MSRISQDLLPELSLHPSQLSVFLPPGIVCFLHLFWRFLSCHLSGGTLLVKLLVKLWFDSFLSTVSTWDCFSNPIDFEKIMQLLLLDVFIQLGYTW